MYYLISEIHYHTARACKRSGRNWLTAAIKPKKTKVSKKERIVRNIVSIIDDIYIVILDSLMFWRYILFTFSVYIRVIYYIDTLLFTVTLSYEHIIFSLIIALSHLVFLHSLGIFIYSLSSVICYYRTRGVTL